MYKAYILTISDRSYRKEREDGSGVKAIDILENAGYEIAGYEILPDERDMISNKLREIADESLASVVFTLGGTGFSERDVTPEATEDVLEKNAPGISELLRRNGESSILSRGVSGLRKKTLIINLPGSPKAVSESLSLIKEVIKHGLDVLSGNVRDCAKEGK